MDNPSDDERSRPKESEESALLPGKTFKGDGLTRAKKLRSPVRSNESSSAAMPTPVPALVVYNLDDQTPSFEHYEDSDDAADDDDEADDEDDGDEDDDEVSDSGSSTPKASRQSFGAYRLTSPPLAYVTTTTTAATTTGSSWRVERPSTPRGSRQMEEGAYTLPARAYSPPGGYRYGYGGRRRGHGRNDSVSSIGTVRPAQSEQEVLDAMIDDLSRAPQQRGDDRVYERGLELKPARSLRRERRQG